MGALGITGASGALSSVTGSPFPVNQAPFLVLAHPSGQFVYTENLDPTGAAAGLLVHGIGGFSVDPSTGTLAEMPQSPFPLPVSASVVGFALHPSGKFLYLSTGLSANGILAWSIDSTTGQLAVLPSSPILPGTSTFGEVFDPAGKFLYVSAGAAGGILGFSVDSTSGALTPLPGSPFASSAVLTSPGVDPAGRFLFTVDVKNKAIAGFRIDSATGNLTSLGSPTAIATSGGGFITLVRAP
jgi:6-phosphogluconolactonase (cycloisomerase 2 family)